MGDKKVIVFANTKANCELVSQTLYAKGYSCTVLHSGKSQVPAPSSFPDVSGLLPAPTYPM